MTLNDDDDDDDTFRFSPKNKTKQKKWVKMGKKGEKRSSFFNERVPNKKNSESLLNISTF